MLWECELRGGDWINVPRAPQPRNLRQAPSGFHLPAVVVWDCAQLPSPSHINLDDSYAGPRRVSTTCTGCRRQQQRRRRRGGPAGSSNRLTSRAGPRSPSGEHRPGEAGPCIQEVRPRARSYAVVSYVSFQGGPSPLRRKSSGRRRSRITHARRYGGVCSSLLFLRLMWTVVRCVVLAYVM